MNDLTGATRRCRSLLLCAGAWMTGALTLYAQPSADIANSHRDIKAPARRSQDPQLSDIAQAATIPGTSTVPMANYIDEYIFGAMKARGVPHAGLSGDEEFLRRVCLDLTGRLPEPEVSRAFFADKRPDKRVRLIDSLMATPDKGRSLKLETAFLDRWTYFFCDLYQVSIPHMEQGERLFGDYLRLALLDNVPYDELVREILTATSRSNWVDGPVNFLTAQEVDDFNDRHTNQEDTYDQIAITTGKVFLGINLECVSCHNGKDHLEKTDLGLSRINRAQLWRQAAFFSKLNFSKPYSIAQEFAILEKGRGYDITTRSVQRMPRYKADVSPEFLLTGEKPRPGENWRDAFARMLTSSPQFARATVNLFWAELMGAGIVDPPFSFDLARQDPANPPPAPWTIQPTNPQLLDALAKDFQNHHFNLRYLMRTIVNSSAYQLSSHFDGAWQPSYEPYFARHFVHRLSPEMIADAVSQATRVFNEIHIKYSDRTASFVLQTYAPDGIAGKAVGPESQFMRLLGQTNRETLDRDYGGSMVEASALLNSTFIRSQVQIGSKGRLHDLLNRQPPLSNDQIADEMFLAFLCRFPRPDEKSHVVDALNRDRVQGLQDLAWTLINLPQFVLDY